MMSDDSVAVAGRSGRSQSRAARQCLLVVAALRQRRRSLDEDEGAAPVLTG